MTKAAMTESVCLLCDEQLDEQKITVVKERGIQTLINSSIERRDGKHGTLKKESCIPVHEKCRIAYNKKSNICKALFKPSDAKETRSGLDLFDFKKNCIFCGNAADDTFMKLELKKLFTDVIKYIES